MADISFIIPAYNEEAYIRGCLDSILELDGWEEQEIIVVDNGSTDLTMDIILKDYPFVRLVYESRRGTGWARQAGFEAAHGEYLAFIDADNRLPHDWLEQAGRFINRKPDAALYTGCYRFGLANARLESLYWEYFVPLANGTLNFFRLGGLSRGGNMIIPRSALEAVGGFDTSIEFWGDDAMTAKTLRKLGPIVYSARLSVYGSQRRIEKGGLLRTLAKYWLNHLWIILFNKPFHKKYKPFS